MSFDRSIRILAMHVGGRRVFISRAVDDFCLNDASALDRSQSTLSRANVWFLMQRIITD